MLFSFFFFFLKCFIEASRYIMHVLPAVHYITFNLNVIYQNVMDIGVINDAMDKDDRERGINSHQAL